MPWPVCGASVLALAFAISVGAAAGHAQDLPEGWEPAMLFLRADSMTITAADHGQTLTLHGVHPVVSITSSLETSRAFDAFAVEDFDAPYNSCNDMKNQMGLWHEDGANTLVVYASGPDNGDAAGYRMYAPLVTNPEKANTSRIVDRQAGRLPLFVDEARHNPNASTMTFLIDAQTPAAVGDYSDVTLMTECLSY